MYVHTALRICTLPCCGGSDGWGFAAGSHAQREVGCKEEGRSGVGGWLC